MESHLINKIFEAGDAAAVAKIGFSELKAIDSYMQKTSLSEGDLHDIFVVAGVFPPTDNSLSRFCEVYLESMPNIDVYARWLDEREKNLILSVSPESSAVNLRDLEPYYWDSPWTKHLKDRNVLVVSPFASSIESQYKNRKGLWSDRDLLPDFNLETIRCPLSWYISPNGLETWEDGLEDLKDKMNSKVFDACLIGAGAWSLPLTAYAKSLGATSIHLGGSLQILFGIKGGRWDEHDVISKFYNESWTRPSEGESPTGRFSVENGCYW